MIGVIKVLRLSKRIKLQTMSGLARGKVNVIELQFIITSLCCIVITRTMIAALITMKRLQKLAM